MPRKFCSQQCRNRDINRKMMEGRTRAAMLMRYMRRVCPAALDKVLAAMDREETEFAALRGISLSPPDVDRYTGSSSTGDH